MDAVSYPRCLLKLFDPNSILVDKSEAATTPKTAATASAP